MTEPQKALGEPARSLLDLCLRSEEGKYDLSNWPRRDPPVPIPPEDVETISRVLRENGYIVTTEAGLFVFKAKLARRMVLLQELYALSSGWPLEQAITQAQSSAQEDSEKGGGEALYQRCVQDMGHAVRANLRQTIVNAGEICALEGSDVTCHSPYSLPAEERVKLCRFAAMDAMKLLTADGTVKAETRFSTEHHAAEAGWPAHVRYRLDILITW